MLTKYRPGLLALVALGLAGLIGHADPVPEKDAIAERMRKDIFFLASDECEGRGVGTLGLDLAAHYVAAQFKMAGLKPGGVDGTYFQPMPFATNAKLDGDSTLVLEGPDGKKIELKQGVDFQVVGSSAPGKRRALLVFVGYGVAAKDSAYNDYASIDVKGKVVVALRRVPRWSDKDRPFDGAKNKAKLAELDTKHNVADGLGAAAVILVNDASELPNDGLLSFQVTKGISTLSTPFVHIKRSVFDGILKSSTGKDLKATEKAIDDDLKPHSAVLEGWTAVLDVKVKRQEVLVKNVIAYIDGKGPLANETVVVGAHYDHLGYADRGGSRSPKSKGKIHYGADDNGSGTTAMIELARRFGANKDREGRRMVFIAFTAEEMGLIGSQHYTQVQPMFPLKSTSAMFNLDMVGRLNPRIIRFDDGIITLADEDGKETGKYSLAEGCKFYLQAKGVKEEIKDGASADVFKKIPAKGLSAALTRDAKDKVIAITVSREPTLLVEGFNTAKEFDALVTKMNPGFDIVKKNSRGFFSSDQYNFYLQKIPVVFFWTGEHADYHTPTDTADKINVVGMKKIADYAERVIDHLRTNPKRPEYTEVPFKLPVGKTPPGGPSLRFRPDLAYEDKGVFVEDVIAGGPADQAGLKKGDVIIELAGKAVASLESYQVIRVTLKSDVAVEMKVLRDKKEITLKVTPK